VRLLDAHNHLHDVRLAPHRAAILEELARMAVAGAVVNGTCEEDWGAVSDAAAAHSFVLPSFGLHPWNARERSTKWLEKLRACLVSHPGSAVGEIGLDRWIEGHDLPDQTAVFRAQLELSVELARPVTIHCVRAWGALWEVLRTAHLPSMGFLLHAFAGPAEMVAGFVDRGAYFSFSPSFLAERKTAQREIFRTLPDDRILVETDAPDLAPPEAMNPRLLRDPSGAILNHPANIDFAYTALAELRAAPLGTFAEQIAGNFKRLFGAPRKLDVAA